jgi:hypothetical protein
MILNLPFEVILGIAKHVSFGDKPHLMRTCRRLHDIVSKASTEYLDLMGYGGNTDMLVRKFRSRDFDGSKVKILRIDLDTLSDEIYNQLPEIFPTVARVINRNNLCFENPNTVCPLLKWKKSIEVCRTSEDWWAVFNFLEQDPLPILNELEIGHEEDDFRMEEIENTLYFLPYIANAPSLTMLTLFNCDISLDLLEKVHDACPHIKYLELSNIFIHINDDILPQDIKLATPMTHLKVWNDTTLFDPKCVFQDYILAKYPNLVYLQLNVNCNAQKAEKSLLELYSGFGGTFESDNDDEYDDGEEGNNDYNNGNHGNTTNLVFLCYYRY